MQLRFKTPHCSITSFPDIEIPKLTVVFGPNGSGKTHLLQAIKLGHLVINGIGPSEVLLLNTSEFIVASQFASSVSKNTPYEGNISSFFDHHFRPFLTRLQAFQQNLFGSGWDQIKSHFREAGIIPEAMSLSDLPWITQKIDLTQEQQTALGKYLKISVNASDEVRRNPLFNAAVHIAELKCVDLSSIDENDFRAHSDIVDTYFSDSTWALIFDISRVFRGYRERSILNDFRRYRVAIGRADSREYLSDEEFVARYGGPPWDMINDILSEITDFKYQFAAPNFDDSDVSYQALLVDKNSNTSYDIDVLSSGEKTLLRLAVSIYSSGMRRASRLSSRMPKLLLLDEVDATLHPAMIAKFFHMIKSSIVDASNVGVILTTHSPTTIAMAPEDGIFLKDSKQSSLVKANKKWALDLLCEGIIRVSEVQRFVFVEGVADKEYYTIVISKLTKYNAELSKIIIVCPIAKIDLQVEKKLERLFVYSD